MNCPTCNSPMTYTEGAHCRALGYWRCVACSAVREERAPAEGHARELSKFRVMAGSAGEWARHSKCSRHAVGCVIFPPDCSAVAAVGYNGPPNGAGWTCDPKLDPCGCVHAEVNALLRLAPRDWPRRGLIMHVTTEPCWRCANAILSCHAVGGVVYGTSGAHSQEGVELLERAGMQTWPAGLALSGLAGGFEGAIRAMKERYR